MKAAKQVHGVGKITSSVHSARFQQGGKMRVPGASIVLHTRKLSFGNVRLRTVYRPAEQHSLHPIPNCAEALLACFLLIERKEEVYAALGFWSER